MVLLCMGSCTEGCYARFFGASRWRETFSCRSHRSSQHLSLSSFIMANNLARALNSWSREGLDLLGGADGAELLGDFPEAAQKIQIV